MKYEVLILDEASVAQQASQAGLTNESFDAGSEGMKRVLLEVARSSEAPSRYLAVDETVIRENPKMRLMELERFYGELGWRIAYAKGTPSHIVTAALTRMLSGRGERVQVVTADARCLHLVAEGYDLTFLTSDFAVYRVTDEETPGDGSVSPAREILRARFEAFRNSLDPVPLSVEEMTRLLRSPRDEEEEAKPSPLVRACDVRFHHFEYDSDFPSSRFNQLL